jgi:hypothetical protein
MTSEQQSEAEVRIRAAMQRLLAGAIPDGLKCDIKSLCVLAGVPRPTLYRTYPHLKAEFQRLLTGAWESGQQPDPRLAQIERLKGEVAELRARLGRNEALLAEGEAFRAVALSRFAAQHDEILILRRELQAAESAKVRLLPVRQD